MAFFAGVFLVVAFLVAVFLVAGLAVTFFLAELALDLLELGSSATVPGKSITGVARSFSDNICKAK